MSALQLGLKRIDLRLVIVAVAMVVAAGLAMAMKPTKRVAGDQQRLDLNAAIPKQFADWKLDDSIVPITVSPDVQDKLDKIYDQTVSRTYVNRVGQRVMLSVAYGSEQTKALQVHRPEVCYVAQGFQVHGMIKTALNTLAGEIPVMRLIATQGNRREPITYWITIGDRTVRGGIEQKLATIRYGLTGVIADGVIFRVSTISKDDAAAYEVQDMFVRDLLQAIPPENRVRLVGRLV